MKHFINDESGAVTVDWVVLTAAVVGLGLTLVGLLYDASLNSTANVGTIMSGFSN